MPNSPQCTRPLLCRRCATPAGAAHHRAAASRGGRWRRRWRRRGAGAGGAAAGTEPAAAVAADHAALGQCRCVCVSNAHIHARGRCSALGRSQVSPLQPRPRCTGRQSVSRHRGTHDPARQGTGLPPWFLQARLLTMRRRRRLRAQQRHQPRVRTWQGLCCARTALLAALLACSARPV
jgi:hypothetical protein